MVKFELVPKMNTAYFLRTVTKIEKWKISPVRHRPTYPIQTILKCMQEIKK